MQIHIFNSNMEETIELLQIAIGNSGMLLLAHINGQANAARIGETVHAVRILEVFRPELAVRVWRTYPPAGIEIPVRLYLYEDTHGHSVVSYRSLYQAMLPYQHEELSNVGREADQAFASIMWDVSGACGQLV
jgi:uncharacterized protein (DUF302 family)